MVKRHWHWQLAQHTHAEYSHESHARTHQIYRSESIPSIEKIKTKWEKTARNSSPNQFKWKIEKSLTFVLFDRRAPLEMKKKEGENGRKEAERSKFRYFVFYCLLFVSSTAAKSYRIVNNFSFVFVVRVYFVSSTNVVLCTRTHSHTAMIVIAFITISASFLVDAKLINFCVVSLRRQKVKTKCHKSCIGLWSQTDRLIM